MRRRASGKKLSLAGALVGVGLIVSAFVGVGSGSGSHRNAVTPVVPGIFTSPASPGSSRSIRQPSGGPVSPPVELSFPTLSTTATIEPVVTTNGVLAVPVDPAEVGWWTGSARPGAAVGSVVVDGHVDSAELGIGALFHLTQLKAGDAIAVTSEAGLGYRYRVYERQIYSKRHALPASLFAKAGPARLVLITCGGPFDQATGSYQDNVVVLASPIAG